MTRQSSNYWTIPREWEGETAFIVAGGPSAPQQPLELLRGGRVIAINARYIEVPFADFVFGMDQKFFRNHEAALRQLSGRVITTVQAVNWPGLLKVKQVNAPGHDDPHSVYCGCTSLSGSMDLARQLGAKRLVLIGADGNDTPEARKHHAQRYPDHPHRSARYRDWKQVLQRLVKALQGRGIEVFNASPGSAYDAFIPQVDLREMVEDTVTTPFNPNDFHDDLVGPQAAAPVAPVVAPELAAAIDAANASLAKSKAKGKDVVKLASVHLRALMSAVE